MDELRYDPETDMLNVEVRAWPCEPDEMNEQVAGEKVEHASPPARISSAGR